MTSHRVSLNLRVTHTLEVPLSARTGGALLAALIIFLIFFYFRRKRNRSSFITPIVLPRQRPITEDHNGIFSDLRDTRTHIQNAAEAHSASHLFSISMPPGSKPDRESART